MLVGAGASGTTLADWLTNEASISVPTGSATLPAVGSNINGGVGPTITNTTGDVLTLADGNTITGVILDPVASAGIAGDGVEGLVIEFVIIITSGGENDNEGIRLTEVTGTLTFSSIDIGSGDGGTNSGTAIEIDGGTAQLNFNDVDIDQSGGSLISIINTFASTLMFDEESQLTLGDSTAAAVTIQSNDGGTVVINNVNNTDPNATVVFNIVGNTGTNTQTSVNDAPSFEVPAAAPAVLEDAAGQTIANFVTSVSPGPADESDQSVTFHVVANTNASMFGVLPMLSDDGTLTYTLAANAVGTATISVEARDNGGTDDGGVDTSDVKTFDIVVTPVTMLRTSR